MLKERAWTETPQEKLPVDQKITQVELEYWSNEMAEALGFPELVPEREPDVAFYVGVGMNSNWEMVGAKLLSKKPINQDQERWVRERLENQLREKAKKIFGLIDNGNPTSEEES